jgi:hypothetical protein
LRGRLLARQAQPTTIWTLGSSATPRTSRWAYVRASFPVTFGKTKLEVGIDVGVGELLTPGVEVAWYPIMLPHYQAFRLTCCSRDTMVAEKMALTVEFGAEIPEFGITTTSGR